jgi:hypothetical protein
MFFESSPDSDQRHPSARGSHYDGAAVLLLGERSGLHQQRLEASENLLRQYLEPPLGLVARINGIHRVGEGLDARGYERQFRRMSSNHVLMVLAYPKWVMQVRSSPVNESMRGSHSLKGRKLVQRCDLPEVIIAALKRYGEACDAYAKGDLTIAKQFSDKARFLIAEYEKTRVKIHEYILSDEDRFTLSRL